MENNNQKFLKEQVNPILEKLVQELYLNQPSSVVEFMVDWLKSKGTEIEKQIKSSKKNKGKDPHSSDSEDDETEEPLLDVKQLQKLKQDKNFRTSVSAEAYGVFHKKTDFKPIVINKTVEQRKRIEQRLNQAFMFQGLDEQEKKIVIDAMKETLFKAGQTVIQQGEDGDNLYVIDKGQLDCYKRFKKDEQPTHLKVYQAGEAFGELALLYNAPRAATIIAKSDSTLFALDRQTFNHIVKDAAAKKREKYEQFLSKVEILHDMDSYERMQIADALKSKKYQKGEYIVKEGELGNDFYILEVGEATATKTLEKGKPPKDVYQYKSGDYFGELALIKNTPRAANIIAKSDCSVVYLDRDSFKRLLGPIEDILKRNFAKYEKYMG